jgi:hypothetical protein
MFIDRNDILNLYVVTNLQLPDAAVPPSGPVPRDIGTSTAANVGDTVTDNAYAIVDARVMNDGNRFRRFGRSPHIDLGPRRANHGNTNYAVPRDPDTARISSVILWCSRFGVPEGITARYRAPARSHHLRLSTATGVAAGRGSAIPRSRPRSVLTRVIGAAG